MEDLEIGDFKSRRKCFIINSIKHPDEVIAFQKVYDSSFYLIGVFSSEEERKEFLKSNIHEKHYNKIESLIIRDNDDINSKNGQKLRDVFTKSDYFIRYSNTANLKDKLNRFVELIFDFGVNTPSKDENAIFQATAAAVNSACLSRQVGACITDKEGEILSIGWNDVPKYGGGVYLDTDKNDQRCFCENWECCTNSDKKDHMIDNILSDLTADQLVTSTDVTKIEKILKKNGIKDLIEFGRSVHAEMSAIIIGSQQTGDRMRGGKLYCTTFPCHNCARHIIMAGIKEVYYIEPYPKSLCLELHKDAITEKEEETDKVKLLMYEGVAPKSFIKFYQLISDDRKEKVKNGQNKTKIKPKHKVHLEALHEKEAHYVKYVDNLGLIQK
jgi:deoxycytidylate deaminase